MALLISTSSVLIALFEITKSNLLKANVAYYLGFGCWRCYPSNTLKPFEKWIAEEIRNNLCSYHCLAQIWWGILCQ